ncbi:MAG: hypothetical protein ACT4OZ_05465 [Gemmatimonadota bacterium]
MPEPENRPTPALRRRTFGGVTAFLLIGVAGVPLLPAGAQRRGPAFHEARIDVFRAGHTALHGAFGLGSRLGTYTRLVGIAGVGRDLSEDATTEFRIEGVGRFVLDPFREQRFGVYGLAGITLFVRNDRGVPRILAGVGVEGPVSGGRAFAAELALGGGLRLGLAVRSAVAGRR